MNTTGGPPVGIASSHRSSVQDLFSRHHLRSKEASMSARPKPRIAAVKPFSQTLLAHDRDDQDGHIKVEIMYDEISERYRVHIEIDTEPPERPYLANILRDVAEVDVFPRDPEKHVEVRRRRTKDQLILTIGATIMLTAMATSVVVVVLLAAFMGRI